MNSQNVLNLKTAMRPYLSESLPPIILTSNEEPVKKEKNNPLFSMPKKPLKLGESVMIVPKEKVVKIMITDGGNTEDS